MRQRGPALQEGWPGCGSPRSIFTARILRDKFANMTRIRLGSDVIEAAQVLGDLEALGKLSPMLKDIAINRIVVAEFASRKILPASKERIEHSILLFRHELGLDDELNWLLWLDQNGQDTASIQAHVAVSLQLQSLAESLNLESVPSIYERQASSLAQLTVSYLASPFKHAIAKAEELMRSGHSSFEQMHDLIRRELGLPVQYIRQALPQGAFRPGIREALQQLNPGQTTDLVESAGQWHLIRLEDRVIRNLDMELKEKLLRDQIVEWATKQMPSVLEIERPK